MPIVPIYDVHLCANFPLKSQPFKAGVQIHLWLTTGSWWVSFRCCLVQPEIRGFRSSQKLPGT